MTIDIAIRLLEDFYAEMAEADNEEEYINNQERFKALATITEDYQEGSKPMKRHLIRIDDDLFIKLQKLAEGDSRSVNQYIKLVLIAHLDALARHSEPKSPLERKSLAQVPSKRRGGL